MERGLAHGHDGVDIAAGPGAFAVAREEADRVGEGGVAARVHGSDGERLSLVH